MTEDGTGERRPIAARGWKASQRAAGWMAARGVSPDGISIAGMICGITAGLALGATSDSSSFSRLAWLAGAALIQLRLLANMFDGMVAIGSQRASPLGQLYNEVPDRFSDAATLIGMGYAAGGNVTLGYVAACVAVATAYIRAAGKVAGAHQEFCGPMAKQQRMFTVTVIAVYCALAPQAWQRVTVGSSEFGLPALGLAVIVVGGLWTFVRRLRRIASALQAAERANPGGL